MATETKASRGLCEESWTGRGRGQTRGCYEVDLTMFPEERWRALDENKDGRVTLGVGFNKEVVCPPQYYSTETSLGTLPRRNLCHYFRCHPCPKGSCEVLGWEVSDTDQSEGRWGVMKRCTRMDFKSLTILLWTRTGYGKRNWWGRRTFIRIPVKGGKVADTSFTESGTSERI